MGANQSSNTTTLIQQVLTNIVNNNTNTNRTSISNVIQNIQSINIVTDKDFDATACKNFTIANFINANMKIMTNITNQITQSIKNDIQAQLDAEASQLMKGVYDMLGGLGSINSQENSIYMKQSISNYVTNNITNENLNTIINKIFNKQTITLTLSGKIGGDQCNISNNILVDMQVQAMVNNMINNAINNKSISRAAARIKQDNSIETKGLTSLVTALLPVLIIGMILIGIFIITTTTGGIKALSNPKFLWTVVALIAIYVVLAIIFKWWPFKRLPKPQYWGCEKKNINIGSQTLNVYTGKCIQYDSKDKGPYSDQKTCEANVNNCPLFYGCGKKADGTFTGDCQQYDNPADGPYSDISSCQSDIRNGQNCCSNCFICINKGSACKQISDPINWSDYEVKRNLNDCNTACGYTPPSS